MISKFDEMNRTMYKFIKKKPIKAPMQLNQMKITPGNRDYENGYIVRYFARQTNSIQSPIIEIDLKTYKKVAKQEDGFYKLITIDWRITGDRENKIINGIRYMGVIDANDLALKSVENLFPGIREAYGNLIKFYRE
tara:strand:- start:446 stop:853 length:408 start_codon:yes stop_codon:yes gene_type:complete